MNLVDCEVTEILSEPYFEYGMWWRKVKSDSWGHIFETNLMFSTEKEAQELEIGYEFQS